MEAARELVARYTRSKASAILAAPELEASPDPGWRNCLGLVQKLAGIENGVTGSIFQDLAVVLRGLGNPTEDLHAAQQAFELACKASPSLEDGLRKDAVHAFEEAFSLNTWETLNDTNVTFLWRTSYCLLSLISVVPRNILELFATNAKLLTAIAKSYDSVLSQASSRGTNISQTALRTKVLLLDTLHILLEHIADRPATTLGVLFPILDLPSSTPSTSTSSFAFDKRTLLGDYEASFHLSARLTSDDASDHRYEYVQSTLQSLAGREPRESGAQVLRSLLPSAKKSAISAASKGKGKAVESASAPLPDMGPAISQVLDILPHEDPAFLDACLRHPFFEGSAEKLLGALLEGNTLPDPLQAMRDGTYVSGLGTPADFPDPEVHAHVDLVSSRKNVFDDAPLDFSQLRIGKNRRENADTVLQDKSFISDYKADILRRAREQAEEEEEAEREARSGVLGRYAAPAPKIAAFEDELSDGEAGESGALVVGDGEASDEDDTSKTTAMIENILELAYIKDPKLFERDSNTRRSKARQDLKTETGWGDEQIEGWKIMLDRNPLKDRILAKHEFQGNRPSDLPTSNANANTHNNAPSQGGGSSRGGRGGRGGGSGGGRGRGGGGDARDRAHKDKMGNTARRRGHDKKMARGGPPPGA